MSDRVRCCRTEASSECSARHCAMEDGTRSLAEKGWMRVITATTMRTDPRMRDYHPWETIAEGGIGKN